MPANNLNLVSFITYLTFLLGVFLAGLAPGRLWLTLGDGEGDLVIFRFLGDNVSPDRRDDMEEVDLAGDEDD